MRTPEVIEAETLRFDRQHAGSPTILDTIIPGISEDKLEPAITQFYFEAVGALRQGKPVFLVAGRDVEQAKNKQIVSMRPIGKFSIQWRQDDIHHESQVCVVLPPDNHHKEERFLWLSSAIHQLRRQQLGIFLLTYPKEKTHRAIVHPEQPLQDHPKQEREISPAINRTESRVHKPRHAGIVPLVTPHGIDLRSTSADDKEHHWKALTSRQREVFTLALQQHMTIPDIARQLNVVPSSIRSVINSALHRIDHPRIQKEKQPAKPREYKPYLWHGVSILTMSADERGDIYSKAYLNDQEIATMEAFIAALPLGKGVYKRVTESIHASKIATVYTTLVKIRRKLENPEEHVPHPKVKKEKTHAPRKQAQFLFEGQSLFDIPEDQRKEIYARVHLTPRNILAIESYIYADQHGLEAPSTNAVGVMLTHIRKKLAHPELYEPKKRGRKPVDHPRVKKEKTYATRAQKQFFFEEKSVLTIDEEKRREIYKLAHLTPREVVAIESYIYAAQQNLKVYEHVAQTLSLKIARVGWVMTNIRKKLAHPEMYEPKPRLPPSLVTPEGKEKTHVYRARKPFLFEGQPIIAIQEEQRQEIYMRAHLTPTEILAIESYIYAIQHDVGIDTYIAQSLNTTSTHFVSKILTHVRKKLAHPELYEPKKRGRKPGQPHETTTPRTTLSAQEYLLSQITGEDNPTPKITKNTIHRWAVEQMLPKEVFHSGKPNLVRRNQYVSLMRKLIQLSKKKYPDLVTTVTQLIRENTPIPSFVTIVERIEELLPELLLKTYINRFPKQPLTKQNMDRALLHQGLAQGKSIKPLLDILAALDTSKENSVLFGKHRPFAAYTLPAGSIDVHLKILSNALFSMAASTSFGTPCREAIRTRIKLSRATGPVARFLQPILLQDNQQEALEQALHEKFDWATIYLDITPLGLGQPETKRQRELAEFINTKISQ